MFFIDAITCLSLLHSLFVSQIVGKSKILRHSNRETSRIRFCHGRVYEASGEFSSSFIYLNLFVSSV